MDEKRREEKRGRAILRKIWKFIEFKSLENWETAQFGYFCPFAISGNSYICHIMHLNGTYMIRLSRNRTTFFEFDFALPVQQNGKLAKKFATLYWRLDVFFQEKLAKEKDELLTRFLRESDRIGKHVHHTDRPSLPTRKASARPRRKKWQD